MSINSTATNQDLKDAIAAIKSGDKKQGRALLAAILKTDRKNEAAWLWMSAAVESKDKQIKCLQNVLRINPGNETAARNLRRLKGIREPDQAPLQAERTAFVARVSPSPQETPPSRQVLTDEELIQDYIARMTSRGWKVGYANERGVQLVKPKQWSKLLVISGLLLSLVGIGLFILVLAVIDYMIKKERNQFVTVAYLRKERTGEDNGGRVMSVGTGMPTSRKVIIGIIGFLILMMIVSFIIALSSIM